MTRHRKAPLAGLVALLASAALLGVAPGQNVTPPLAPRAEAPSAAEEKPAADTGTERLISLKFDAAPLQQVLQFYCDETGRTLLTSPDVATKGSPITLRSQSKLTPAEALQAIETILAMNGITLLPVGDKFVKVINTANARTEGNLPFTAYTNHLAETNQFPENDQLISEIIPLRFLEVGDAQQTIGVLVHTYGKIQPLPRINALLVTETGANINRMRELLRQVDLPVEANEELRIIPIAHTKASEIQKKLEEILSKTQAGAKPEQATVARPAQEGPPGVTRTIPGVIRAPTAAAPSAATPAGATATTVDEGQRGLITGTVKMVSDDRTGILILITRKENMKFFDDIVQALDVVREPDVQVKVFRLEYAEAESVAKMLNDLIGASSTKSAEAAPSPVAAAAAAAGANPAGAEAGAPAAAPAARSTGLQEYLRNQTAALQAGPSTGERTKIGELVAANIKILPDKRTNALIIMATRGDMATLTELITDMDINLSQVMIEAVILQVDLASTSQTGVNWVQRAMVTYNQGSGGAQTPIFSFAGAGGAGNTIPTPTDAGTLTSSAQLTPVGGLTYYFTHYGLNIDAVLQLAATDNRTHVLQQPTIFTTDNKKAEVDFSTEVYVYSGQTPTSVGGVVAYVPNVALRKVGINLTVTPHINPKGFVSMEITQKIEAQSGTQTIQGEGDYPTFSSRSLTASVAVKSGETIVLGGLVGDTKTASYSKIPILGDLPLIGILFGSGSHNTDRQEVIVFLTPYVLDTVEDIADDAKSRKAALHAEGMWQKGWSRSKLAEPAAGQADTDQVDCAVETPDVPGSEAPVFPRARPTDPSGTNRSLAPQTPPPGGLPEGNK